MGEALQFLFLNMAARGRWGMCNIVGWWRNLVPPSKIETPGVGEASEIWEER